MTISELVIKLEKIKKEHGDIRVVTQTLSHTWPPEPVIRGQRGLEYVLLNP